MLKRILTGLSAAAVLAVAVPTVAEAQMKMPEGKQYTVTGTVVDFACKFTGGMTGEKHRMCAQVCADNGVPLAILASNGTLYVPVGNGMPPQENPNEQLKQFAEQQVTVTGTVFEAGGANAIKISEVKKATY